MAAWTKPSFYLNCSPWGHYVRKHNMSTFFKSLNYIWGSLCRNSFLYSNKDIVSVCSVCKSKGKGLEDYTQNSGVSLWLGDGFGNQPSKNLFCDVLLLSQTQQSHTVHFKNCAFLKQFTRLCCQSTFNKQQQLVVRGRCKMIEAYICTQETQDCSYVPKPVCCQILVKLLHL